jgi:hypothetical protein
MNKRNTTYLLKEGLDGLLEAVFEVAAEDEWKAQRARLRVATGTPDICKVYAKMIRNEIGAMLVEELAEYPATHTRTKQLREQTFNRIMEKIGGTT